MGLMSGTSADGIDAALVEITTEVHYPGVKLLHFESRPYPLGIRDRILHLPANPDALREICHLNVLLGELFAQAALDLLKAADSSPAEVALIGSHGQTICHLPAPVIEGDLVLRSTLQIGEPSVIAEQTGLCTVADFRPRDVAAGGEGAPLTPYPHYLLFGHPERCRVVLNIGGICNLTFLPPGAPFTEISAFDAGPGNVLIDGMVRRLSGGVMDYDADGAWAASGRVTQALLQRLLGHPFFRRPPPRSAGQEEFGPRMVDELLVEADQRGIPPNDLAATLSAFSVEAVVGSLETHIFPRRTVDEILLCGGGVRNRWLREALEARLAPCRVLITDEIGFPAQGVEAASFAVLAYLTFTGQPGNLPTATGARQAVILGKIIPGKGYSGLGP
ncbi:MAG: anhydro-N-acetylmuramic acid kinase [Candidatus Methylomirabilales bacterium]